MSLKKTIFLFLSITYFTSYAQKRILTYSMEQAAYYPFLKPSTTATLQETEKKIKESISKLIEEGYLTCALDSLRHDSLETKAYLHVGEKYLWTQLGMGNLDKDLLRKAGLKENLFENKPINPKQLNKIFNSLIGQLENEGYPFAAVKLDSIVLKENTLKASITLKKNKLIHLDSVIIKGTATINPVYLYNYLSLAPGDLYQEEPISDISIKLTEIPFIQSNQPPEVLFLKNITKLTIFADKKKASKFNGIIGFLPNPITNNILITGDVQLMLNNELGRGEKIDLNWRKIQNNVTDLKTSFTYPFILSTPFGAQGSFYLYRRDTLYQDINSKVNVQYILPGASNIGLFYDNKTSRLLSTSKYRNSNTLPDNLDIIKHTYGANLRRTKLDYRYNPRKGYDVDFEGGLGNRRIIKNPDLSGELYDTLNVNSTQYNVSIRANLFLPVTKNSTLNIGIKGARLQSSTIFVNEQYRIGGFKTLRGFDEESIFASTYSIATLEYRYILEQNSFARVFFDGAYYENKTQNSFNNDFPFGFGLGFNFETKAGIFSLDYALGYQQKELAPIRSAKIHFGFINYF